MKFSIFNFQFRRLKGGFTLIETLVAVSIFSISITALMAVLGQGISNTNYARQKIIATYLAQEGIEYIRNLRDTFVLYDPTSSNNGWNNFKTKIGECGNSGGGNQKTCYFNDQNLDFNDSSLPITDITIVSCGNSLCTIPLKYDSNTGKYNYGSSGVNSGFIRSIQARYPADPDDYVKVYSIVSWTQGSGNYSVTFSEDLFNWVQ